MHLVIFGFNSIIEVLLSLFTMRDSGLVIGSSYMHQLVEPRILVDPITFKGGRETNVLSYYYHIALESTFFQLPYSKKK